MENDKKIKDNKDFYNVDKAVKRLIWRLAPKDNGQFNTFRPNEEDLSALKSILGSLDRDKKINVANNKLFAKLYIYHLTMNIRYFGTTAVDEYPEKDLSRLLSKPLDLFIKAFYNDLHDNQFNKLLSTEDQQEQEQIVEQGKKLKETFTEDFVESKLLDSVNKALKRFS